MDDVKRTIAKRIIWLLPVLVLIGMTVFILRGPHISNALKKIILPELEMMLGRKVIAQKIYLNIFPMFIEARGVKIFDENGDRILAAERVKAYAGLTGLLRKELPIRRLVIRAPEITAYRRQIDDIAKNIKAYLEKVREDALKVKIKTVDVQNGNVVFNDPENSVVMDLRGLSSEIAAGKNNRIVARIKQFSIKKEELPVIAGDADMELSVAEDSVELKRFSVGIQGSKVSGSGRIGKDEASFSPDAEILISSVKKVFGLKERGDGKIHIKGVVADITNKPAVDLKVDGSFYLQTLMELLKVREKVEGFTEVKGVIKGPLTDLKASGRAILKKGNLFDVEVDSLTCSLSYAGNKLSFVDGDGRLYNGKARASAAIRLPVVDYYTLDIDFKDVDSKPLFKLIGWDPGIAAGKVTGSLKNAGSEFNPSGAFFYRSVEKGKDILGRINEIAGTYRMQGTIVHLTDMKLLTGKSEILADGKTDFEKKTLDFIGSLKTSDITDLSSPYYMKLQGTGDFKGRITGTYDNPVLSGGIRIIRPVLEKNKAELLTTDISYSRSSLEIRKMNVQNGNELYALRGDIYFKKARELFDLKEPEYRLSGTAKNARLENIAKIFYGGFRGDGKLDTDFALKGTNGAIDIGGRGELQKASIYSVTLDSASFDWRYSDEKLNLTDVNAVRGKSVFSGNAVIGADGFSYKAHADKVLLSDLAGRELKGEAVLKLKSEGHGTFEDPTVFVDGRIMEGRLKGKPVGGGTITAQIKNKDMILQANLLSDKIKVSAKGRLEKEMPWDGKIELHSGRYDSLISSFMKDVPEDLIMSMTATVNLHGNRNHVFAVSEIRQLSLSMYGYSFANENEIRLELSDRKLSFDKVQMRSGHTALAINGNIVIGRNYDLVVEGSSSLSPLKSLSNKIGLLKGDAEFVLSVTGEWDTPQLNGGVSVVNGSFGLKDYSYRASSVSGYLYLDNDKIVLQKLTGKIGGGDADISGVLYLKKFAVRRFYVEAALRSITASVTGDFDVNFGGELLLKGTPESQIVSGDIKINRAKYRERVEWKSLLLRTKKAERHRGEPAEYAKAELNIRLTGKDNIYVDNNVARAALSVDMLLRGTIGRPVILGRLETKDGTVYFRNNEFRIIHASADFADPNRFNPVIQISAETVIQSYKIKMNVEGQMDHFNMSLSSDPVLKEMDILALLTVGRTQEGIRGLEGGIGAGEATSFVTGKMQDVIEERLRTITGFDRFQIDPYVSKNTGTVEPRLTVSKRLMGEKMFVTYSSSVGSTEEQVIKLEYFLSRNMSLVGVRDERGILGGDVRFRFEFK